MKELLKDVSFGWVIVLLVAAVLLMPVAIQWIYNDFGNLDEFFSTPAMGYKEAFAVFWLGVVLTGP